MTARGSSGSRKNDAPVPFAGNDTVQPGPASNGLPRKAKPVRVISGVTKANAAITRGAVKVRQALKRQRKETMVDVRFKNH